MTVHDEYVMAALGERFQEDSNFGFQCVAFAKRYCSKVLEPIAGFGGSAIEGWKTGSPFNGKRKRVKNSATAVPPQGAVIFFKPSLFGNKEGHVAIVDKANLKRVAAIEQNAGSGNGDGLGENAIRIHTYDYKHVLGRFVFIT